MALFAGMGASGVHFIVVVLALRWVRGVAPVIIHFGTTLILSVALVVFLALLSAKLDAILPIWPSLSILAGASVGCLYAFSAVYKSISLSILTALAAAPDGRLARARIASDVVLPRFLERVQLLIADGYVIRGARGYEITLKGRTAVRRLRAVQHLFGVSGSGLYAIE